MARRRQRGDGGLSQRASDGLWIGTLDLGERVLPDGTRKRVRRSVSARTLSEARRKLNALKKDVDRGVTDLAPTVEVWLRHWLETVAAREVRPRTLIGYRSYAETWLIPYLGKHRLDRLRADHIRALYQEMERQGRSDATRRQAHAILSRALSVAESEGKIARNPAWKMAGSPSTYTEHETPLTRVDARAVLAKAAEGPRLARWQVALYLGLRQGEALGLQWQDVNFETGTIYIVRALQRQPGKGLVLVRPKSKTSVRALPLFDFVGEQLLRQRGQPGEYVFGVDGQPMDPRRDWQEWRELLQAAGVPVRALRAARTSTGTLLEDAGVADVVIQRILGHAQVSTTRSIYIQPDDPMVRRGALALAAHLNDETRPST